MYDKEQAISWFQSRAGKVSYSQTSRRGPFSYDCSSAVYYALIQAGTFGPGVYIGNTDSMFNDLEKVGFRQVTPNADGSISAQRGDIFIWGRRGASGGDNGHTGIFVNANDIIHCSSGYNGIAISNHDWLARINGVQYLTIYRFVGGGTSVPKPVEPIDQVINVGSYVKFNQTFRVDDVQHFSDTWQVRTDILCPIGFTWADNGIPAGPLVEVDSDGYATPDQSLDPGSRYVLPGKYRVFDVGQTNGRWLGLLEWNGLKFWVDLEPATEVGDGDGGTPIPGPRPVPQPTTTNTTTEKHEIPTTTSPTTTTSTTVAPVTTTTTTQPAITSTTTVQPTTTTTTSSTPGDDGQSLSVIGKLIAAAWAIIQQIIKDFRKEYTKK